MSVFNNLLGCDCTSKDEPDIIDVKQKVGKNEIVCDILKNDTKNDIKMLDTKFDLKFSMLSNKIDNILMLLNNIKYEQLENKRVIK